MTLADRSTIGEPTHDGATGSWTASLVVDDSDTVFFDHSVDHLPGMLMLHGIAELVERAGPETGGRTAGTFDLDFTRFVEKDRPAYIRISPAGPLHTWRVELTQSDQLVCSGTVGSVALDRGEPSTMGGDATPGALAEAVLVHRSRRENIVVGPLRAEAGEYLVDYVPSEAVRTKRFQYVHGPLDVLEAARQFMILLSHSVCGFDLQTRLILTRLVVGMPRLFPRTAPVHLRAARPRVNRHRVEFTIHAHCGDVPAAIIGWDIKAVTPTVYARLRGMPHE